MTQADTAAADGDNELPVLHALKVRGFAGADGVAESAGLDVDSATTALDAAVESGQAKQRSGRVSGYTLTANGRERHQQLLAASVTPEQREVVSAAYENFLAPNQHFKELTTAHQNHGREGGDDPGTVDALQQVDSEVTGVLDSLTAAVPRFGTYAPRLARARDAFVGGDATMLAAPMKGSYHDVWMELHEDLLATLARERTDDDG